MRICTFYFVNQLLEPIFHVFGPGINNSKWIKVKLGMDKGNYINKLKKGGIPLCMSGINKF